MKGIKVLKGKLKVKSNIKSKTFICALSIIICFLLIACNNKSEDVISESCSNKVDVYVFYGKGCPHCAKLESFLEDIKPTHPNLNIIMFEVYFNQTNREIMEKMAEAFGTKIEGVPMVF
ncbi:MAG: hypothetical protein N3D84_02150, partial [Candidatus Woesearchaeota archaeon]|nr:hypothetical protein [Candidatus Woesearchaeota archaeon]